MFSLCVNTAGPDSPGGRRIRMTNTKTDTFCVQIQPEGNYFIFFRL